MYVSHIAAAEQRFLYHYGGLASHSNAKGSFKSVHNVSEIINLTHNIHLSGLPMVTSGHRLISI